VKNYRDQLKDALYEWGSYWLTEPQGLWSVMVRKQTSGREPVRAASVENVLRLLPLVVEEYETEIARMKARYYNSEIDED
jgi:hypothetical protein